MDGFALVTGGSFMAVVQADLYRHENFVRKSIQIPSTQHKELKALAVELESSLGDVVETITVKSGNHSETRTNTLLYQSHSR